MEYCNNFEIGNRMAFFRKKAGLTQAEAAEKTGLSDHGYAEIERGTTNMRVGTLIKICGAFNVSPNDLLLSENDDPELSADEILDLLNPCTEKERSIAMRILSAYLKSK